MRLKKSISAYLLSCLLLNTSVISVAGDLSEDGRYEFFEDDNLTIKDILEEDDIDMEIKGNTLVNLIKKSDFIRFNKDEDVVVFMGNSTNNNGVNHIPLSCIPTIKPNTEYTFIYKVIESTTTNRPQLYSSTSTMFEQTVNLPKTQGVHKVTFRTKAVLDSSVITFGFYIHNAGDNTDINESNMFSITDTMVLEGDWTNKEVPNYFEGLESSFENQLITQEMVDSGLEDKKNLSKYKVDIIKKGKNVVDLEGKEYSFATDELEYLGNYGESILYNRIDISSLKGEYSLSGDLKLNGISKELSFMFYNEEFYGHTHNLLYHNIITNGNGVVRSSGDCIDLTNYKYMVITTANIYVEKNKEHHLSVENIQLELNNKVTEYQPYTEIVHSIYLSSPLLKWDSIKYINGQLYHIKGSEYTVFDGDENWVNFIDKPTHPDGTEGTISYACIVIDNLYANRNENNIVADNVKSIAGNDFDYTNEIIYSWNRYGSEPNIFLHLDRTKLPTINITGFKNYLKSNPINLVYRLENPIYEPIKDDLAISLFKDTTYISTNSNIPSSIKTIIDRTPNRANEAIELAKINPTVENIALARMWTNLLKESVIKDRLEDSISDIRNIVDMTIEKKKVTANLDMYIKPENSISMSLSTNSITFDNYTGLEDMEKLGALDITINSSLPYNLNAYMPKELSNADGSSSMGVNLLNIRDNTESSYSQFTNTIDKLVLKSDCDKGNNKVHTVDLKIASDRSFKPDIYKAVIKFEAEQK